MNGTGLKTCEYCGAELRNKRVKFCNSACRGNNDKKIYNAIAESLNRHCECCGEKLIRRLNSNGIMESLHTFQKRRFCSVKCAGRFNTNEYTDLGDMTIIETINGDRILIDSDVVSRVSRYCWVVPKNGKCVRTETRSDDADGSGNLLLLSHLIMTPNKNEQIDHINRNPLDNRRVNLRVCTNQQNCCNRGLRSDNSTGYKGVGWHKGKYEARIGCFGKRAVLIYTNNITKAAQSYNIAAEILHGEFARLNEVPPPSSALRNYITGKVNRLFNTGGLILPENEETVC